MLSLRDLVITGEGGEDDDDNGGDVLVSRMKADAARQREKKLTQHDAREQQLYRETYFGSADDAARSCSDILHDTLQALVPCISATTTTVTSAEGNDAANEDAVAIAAARRHAVEALQDIQRNLEHYGKHASPLAEAFAVSYPRVWQIPAGTVPAAYFLSLCYEEVNNDNANAQGTPPLTFPLTPSSSREPSPSLLHEKEHGGHPLSTEHHDDDATLAHAGDGRRRRRSLGRSTSPALSLHSGSGSGSVRGMSVAASPLHLRPKSLSCNIDYSHAACLVQVKRELLVFPGPTRDGSGVVEGRKVLARWPDDGETGRSSNPKLQAVLRSIAIENRKREEWNTHVQRLAKTRRGSFPGDSRRPEESESVAVCGEVGGAAPSPAKPAVSVPTGQSLYWPARIVKLTGHFRGDLFEDTFHGLGLLQQQGDLGQVITQALSTTMDLCADVVFCFDEVSEQRRLRLAPCVLVPEECVQLQREATTSSSGEHTGPNRRRGGKRATAVDARRAAAAQAIVSTVSSAMALSAAAPAPGTATATAASAGSSVCSLSDVLSFLSFSPELESELAGFAEEAYRLADAAEREAWQPRLGRRGEGCPLLVPSTLPDVLSIANYSFTEAVPKAGVAPPAPSRARTSAVDDGCRNSASLPTPSFPPRGPTESGDEAAALRRRTIAIKATLHHSTIHNSPIRLFDLLAGPTCQTQQLILLRPDRDTVRRVFLEALRGLIDRWLALRQALLDQLTAYEEELPCTTWVHLPSLASGKHKDVGRLKPVILYEPERWEICEVARHRPPLELPDADSYTSPFLDTRSKSEGEALPKEPLAPGNMNEEELKRATELPRLQSSASTTTANSRSASAALGKGPTRQPAFESAGLRGQEPISRPVSPATGAAAAARAHLTPSPSSSVFLSHSGMAPEGSSHGNYSFGPIPRSQTPGYRAFAPRQFVVNNEFPSIKDGNGGGDGDGMALPLTSWRPTSTSPAAPPGALRPAGLVANTEGRREGSSSSGGGVGLTQPRRRDAQAAREHEDAAAGTRRSGVGETEPVDGGTTPSRSVTPSQEARAAARWQQEVEEEMERQRQRLRKVEPRKPLPPFTVVAPTPVARGEESGKGREEGGGNGPDGDDDGKADSFGSGGEGVQDGPESGNGRRHRQRRGRRGTSSVAFSGVPSSHDGSVNDEGPRSRSRSSDHNRPRHTRSNRPTTPNASTSFFSASQHSLSIPEPLGRPLSSFATSPTAPQQQQQQQQWLGRGGGDGGGSSIHIPGYDTAAMAEDEEKERRRPRTGQVVSLATADPAHRSTQGTGKARDEPPLRMPVAQRHTAAVGDDGTASPKDGPHVVQQPKSLSPPHKQKRGGNEDDEKEEHPKASVGDAGYHPSPTPSGTSASVPRSHTQPPRNNRADPTPQQQQQQSDRQETFHPAVPCSFLARRKQKLASGDGTASPSTTEVHTSIHADTPLPRGSTLSPASPHPQRGGGHATDRRAVAELSSPGSPPPPLSKAAGHTPPPSAVAEAQQHLPLVHDQHHQQQQQRQPIEPLFCGKSQGEKTAGNKGSDEESPAFTGTCVYRDPGMAPPLPLPVQKQKQQQQQQQEEVSVRVHSLPYYHDSSSSSASPPPHRPAMQHEEEDAPQPPKQAASSLQQVGERRGPRDATAPRPLPHWSRSPPPPPSSEREVELPPPLLLSQSTPLQQQQPVGSSSSSKAARLVVVRRVVRRPRHHTHHYSHSRCHSIIIDKEGHASKKGGRGTANKRTGNGTDASLLCTYHSADETDNGGHDSFTEEYQDPSPRHSVAGNGKESDYFTSSTDDDDDEADGKGSQVRIVAPGPREGEEGHAQRARVPPATAPTTTTAPCAFCRTDAVTTITRSPTKASSPEPVGSGELIRARSGNPMLTTEMAVAAPESASRYSVDSFTPFSATQQEGSARSRRQRRLGPHPHDDEVWDGNAPTGASGGDRRDGSLDREVAAATSNGPKKKRKDNPKAPHPHRGSEQRGPPAGSAGNALWDAGGGGGSAKVYKPKPQRRHPPTSVPLSGTATTTTTTAATAAGTAETTTLSSAAGNAEAHARGKVGSKDGNDPTTPHIRRRLDMDTADDADTTDATVTYSSSSSSSYSGYTEEDDEDGTSSNSADADAAVTQWLDRCGRTSEESGRRAQPPQPRLPSPPSSATMSTTVSRNSRQQRQHPQPESSTGGTRRHRRHHQHHRRHRDAARSDAEPVLHPPRRYYDGPPAPPFVQQRNEVARKERNSFPGHTPSEEMENFRALSRTARSLSQGSTATTPSPSLSPPPRRTAKIY